MSGLIEQKLNEFIGGLKAAALGGPAVGACRYASSRLNASTNDSAAFGRLANQYGP
jgi:hypothetical protein